MLYHFALRCYQEPCAREVLDSRQLERQAIHEPLHQVMSDSSLIDKPLCNAEQGRPERCSWSHGTNLRVLDRHARHRQFGTTTASLLFEKLNNIEKKENVYYTH